jgi:fumarate reductase flavoprotein subunit
MTPETAERCDVVVVGGGGAGLAAAIESATAGSSTVLLEKNRALGGSTAWSVGSVTASGTPHQRRRGIVDRPEWHWADMPLFPHAENERDNVELRRRLCNDMPATFDWLLALGVRFFGPVAEPPHRVPRMHTVLPNSGSFIYHLQKKARALGVKIHEQTAVDSLRIADGRVTGVQYRRDGHVGYLEAGAVILATGDFTSDPVFKMRFMGARAAVVPGVNVTATGDGQRMVEAIGGVIVNGDLALGPELRFKAPSNRHWTKRLPPATILASCIEWSMRHMPQRVLRPMIMQFLTTALAPSMTLLTEGALLVDRDGRRLDAAHTEPAALVADSPGNLGYIILDDRIAKKFSAWPHFISTAPGIAYAYIGDYARNRRDICRAAPSIEALAQSIGVDARALSATVSDAKTAPQGAADHGSSPAAAFGPGPFWALGPVSAVFVHSEGGLKVDLEQRVLHGSGYAIPGLYAAGSTGQGGLLLRGHGHHLAWAFSSGRRAGVSAARFARAAPQA